MPITYIISSHMIFLSYDQKLTHFHLHVMAFLRTMVDHPKLGPAKQSRWHLPICCSLDGLSWRLSCRFGWGWRLKTSPTLELLNLIQLVQPGQLDDFSTNLDGIQLHDWSSFPNVTAVHKTGVWSDIETQNLWSPQPFCFL